MSKEDKSKSSPSPKPGLSFDPSHLLGMHSLAASGLPYSPLAAPFTHPYPFLAQPAAFPGLFGGLGALPNPLHAAALSHSLAAASLYGLPKYPNELGSPPPTSSSPSSKKGKSSRSTPTPSSSPSPSSQQRTSSSTSLNLLSPSSHPSLPSHFDPAAIAPYLSNWALNGSAYHLPLSSPLANEGSSKRASSSLSSSSSRQGKKSSTSSSNSSSKIPQAHQHDSSSIVSSSSSSMLHNPVNPSLETSKYPLDKSSVGENFAFDPRTLITPYHLSPELAYLSQSLFMHRPDLDLSSTLLAASASAAATSSSSSSNLLATPESIHKSGHQSSKHSQSPQTISKKGDRVKGDRSKGEKRARETPDPTDDAKHRLTNGTPTTSDAESHSRSALRVSNHSHKDEGDRSKTETPVNDDPASFDPTNPLHFVDDSRRKQLADQIRKRVGLPDSSASVASLFTEHGLKHSEWLEQWTSAQKERQTKEKEKDEPSGCASTSAKDSEGENEVERRLPETNFLERQLQLHQEQLRELHRKYGIQEQDGSYASHSNSNNHSSYPSRSGHNDTATDNQEDSMDGDASTDSDGGSESSKRPGDSSDQASPTKKRCYQTNERELVIPLEHGWNRQTIISGMGRRGIVGEVLYFAPCGKKMKTIPDVMRYLERNPNSDLGRENFSFNTKVNVGHFFEVRGGQSSTPVPLTDTEVLERIEMSRGKRARMQMLARKKREKAAREQALARQIMENKVKRRMELQEMSRRAAELRFEKKLEKQRQKELEKKLKEDKALEKQKEKEQHRLMKQQERFRLQEQLRKEREMRAQQIIEARNRRQQELEEMRLADTIKRNKEREMKRQQLILLKEQERERRRQHLLLVKALEQRKKQEEKQTKERLREEKLNEKIKLREIRLHQRKVEMEVAAELKKPVEDMELKSRKKLPQFPRLKSRLAGKPVSDCMMVVEFLNNFGVALNLEKSSLPTLESLERGLMCDTEEDVEELMSLVMHLLRFALDDVGVPNPKEAVTVLNQKITEMEMTDTTMSEILRIFIKARGEKEMANWLVEHPIEALNPTQKAAILGFLCNELLTSKVITGEIDKHMESINNLRRDKWIVEGQLRQLRVFQAKKFNKIHKSTDRRANPVTNNFSSVPQDEDTVSSVKMGSDEEEDDKEDEEGSGNESDGGSSVMTNVSSTSNFPCEPLDESMSREESDKRIDGLRKQHAAYRQKVFRSCLRLRAINIGQDRYKRTYWILPLTGGIYVEGMESGEPEDYVEESKVTVKEEIKEEEEVSQEEEEEVVHSNDAAEGDKKNVAKCEASVVKDEENNAGEKAEKKSSNSADVDSKNVATGEKDCDENLNQSVEESTEMEGVMDTEDEPEDMEVSSITGNNESLSQKDNSQTVCSFKAEAFKGEKKDDQGPNSNIIVEDTEKECHEDKEKECAQIENPNNDGKEKGGTLYNMLKVGVENHTSNSNSANAPAMNGHVEDSKQCKLSPQVTPLDNHFQILPPVQAKPPELQVVNGFSDKLEHCGKKSITDLNNDINEASDNDDGIICTESGPHFDNNNESRRMEEKAGKDTTDHSAADNVHPQPTASEDCAKNFKECESLVSIDLSQKSTPTAENETDSHTFETSNKDVPQNSAKSTTAKTGEELTALAQNPSPNKPTATDTQETKGSVSDILKVPKVAHSPRESLFSLLNHSITKTLSEESKTPLSVAISAEVGSKVTTTSTAISSTLPSPASTQSMLSSSLLFSPFSTKQSQDVEEKSKAQSSTPITTASLASPLLVCPSPFASGKLGLPPAHSGKLLNRPDEGALSLMAISPVPLPAHSKPLDRNSLPPHHPAAQFKPHRDQMPPAAHSKQTSKAIPSNLQDIGPFPVPSHQPHPPFIPGLSHHPYGGQASASQTLSSLASIVSPPPAHQHPPSTTASSFLMSTPKLPTFTTSLTSAASSSSPLSSSSTSTSKTPPSFSLIDLVLKNEKHYSSSQLLHHAASQVLLSGDTSNATSSTATPVSPIASTTATASLDMPITNCTESDSISTPLTITSPTTTAALPSESSTSLCSLSMDSGDIAKEGTSQDMWFSILPRTPCDELSLTRPAQVTIPVSSQLPMSSATFSSNSSSPIPSLLNSSLNLESLMPFLQSNPSLLSQESLRTSLQLLASPSPSPTPSSSAGDDFKVPQPPLDSSLNYDPWDILRAAQGEKQQIPKNKRHGWWRIYDLAMLKATMTATMNRGIREKNLQRAIHRYMDYAKIHATFDSSLGEKDPAEVESKTDKKKKKQPETKKEKEGTKSVNRTPTKKDEDRKESTCSMVTSESSNDAPESDQQTIKEEVKEKGEKDSTVKTEETKEAAASSDTATGIPEEQEEEEDDFVPPDVEGAWSTSILHEIELATLEEVEALEDRIYHASLQAKYGWKSCKESDFTLVDHTVKEPKEEECYPLVAARARLLQLELNIERRYLKPPLARSVPLNICSTSDKQDPELEEKEDVPPGLALWRQAVKDAKSPAQLSLCIQMLTKSISWEKSIMRVICQNCRKDDNEAELLLCDGCDKGFHTYCFKPKMETIPDGDWYCFECVSKASGTPHCGLCGSKGGKIVSCSKCPRCVHLECMDPPLPRLPKRWHCINCAADKGNSKRSRKRKESLPTVQRITITKLVIKEEPQDDDEFQATASTPLPSKTDKSTSSPTSSKVESSSPKKTEATVTAQATGESSTPTTSSDKKKRKRKEKDPENVPASMATPPPSKKKEKREKKERKPKSEAEEQDKEEKETDNKNATDQSVCGKLLTELEKHEEGWPFLKPVSQKQFPSYKKYIKTPMDFSTVRNKLKNKGYKLRQEFAADIRLIFDNCETFNEDDSEVGKAGFTMRSFFEQRWCALFPEEET